MKLRYKIFLIMCLAILVWTLFYVFTHNLGIFTSKVEIRIECINNYLYLYWDYSDTCYHEVCEDLNLSYTGSSSWYESEVYCKSDKGAEVKVNWIGFDSESCQFFRQKWYLMRRCIMDKGADF